MKQQQYDELNKYGELKSFGANAISKIRRKNDEENYFNNVMYYAFSIYDDSMWK